MGAAAARVVTSGQHRGEPIVGGHPPIFEARTPTLELGRPPLDFLLGASTPLPLVESELLRLGAPRLLSLQPRQRLSGRRLRRLLAITQPVVVRRLELQLELQ